MHKPLDHRFFDLLHRSLLSVTSQAERANTPTFDQIRTDIRTNRAQIFRENIRGKSRKVLLR